MTLVLQTRTKTEEDGRTQVNIFEILFRRLLGLAILRKANFPKLGLKCQRQRIASVKNAKKELWEISTMAASNIICHKKPFLRGAFLESCVIRRFYRLLITKPAA